MAISVSSSMCRTSQFLSAHWRLRRRGRSGPSLAAPRDTRFATLGLVPVPVRDLVLDIRGRTPELGGQSGGGDDAAEEFVAHDVADLGAVFEVPAAGLADEGEDPAGQV